MEWKFSRKKTQSVVIEKFKTLNIVKNVVYIFFSLEHVYFCH